MNSLFLAEGGTNVTSFILVGVLLLLMIVYLVFGTISRKRNQEQAMKMMSELKVGDKVVTNAGVYGEIVSQRETDMGRVIVLKTGHDDDEKKASYITINASVILGVDMKKDLLLDENGNVIEPEELKEEVLKPASEEEPSSEPEKEEKDDKIEASRKRTAAKRTRVKKDAE